MVSVWNVDTELGLSDSNAAEKGFCPAPHGDSRRETSAWVVGLSGALPAISDQ